MSTWVGGAATPTCPFPQPLGSPGGVPCGGLAPAVPPSPPWGNGTFHLDLHLCLRSQWLRPHPHTSARRLRPWCTLPCKPRVYVYTLCIRYYSWNLFTPNYHRCTNQVFEKMQNIRRIITGMVACFCILGGFVSSSSRRARIP